MKTKQERFQEELAELNAIECCARKSFDHYKPIHKFMCQGKVKTVVLDQAKAKYDRGEIFETKEEAIAHAEMLKTFKIMDLQRRASQYGINLI